MIDSTGTMIAGYVVTTVIYVAYMLILWRRTQRVRDKLRQSGRNTGV